MRHIRNTNVCVIGGAGFLGSHLVDHLVEDRDCSVLVLDNLITGLRKHIHEGAEFKWWDIRDHEEELVKLFDTNNTEYVFNYAAEPYIPECFERPSHFFDINAVAVLNVLNACQKSTSVKGLLQVSSAEIYGDTKGKINEDAVVEPHSTYGVSKLAADMLVQVRWKEAGVPALALRQFNCIGERETHDYVVPEIISQTFANIVTTTSGIRSSKVHLGNNSTRDFQYAGDAVVMAVELLELGTFGEVYNMGSENSITIYNLAKLIGEIAGVKVEVVSDKDRERPWEIWHLCSDNTKLHSIIDYRSKTSLKEALKKTVNYYINNGLKWDW